MKKRKIEIEVEGYLWVCPHDHETFMPYMTKWFHCEHCGKKYKTSDCQLNEWYRHEQIYDDYNNAIQTYKDKLYLKSMEEWLKKPILKIKKHHDRPRPKKLAKKIGIKMEDVEMESMKTPSYPSGHSAQGVLVGMALSDKYPSKKTKLMKIAKDISKSRNIARAHYKSDSKFGEQIGKDMYNHIKNKL